MILSAPLPPTDLPPPPGITTARDLRGHLERLGQGLTRVHKQVQLQDVGALSAQSEGPVLFENIEGHPGFRLCDMLVRNRCNQAAALGVEPADYLRTLAWRLRQPPRGTVLVKDGPAKEKKLLGPAADFRALPIPYHKQNDANPYLSAMILLRDPETGFYNTAHAGTTIVGPQTGLSSFVTSHSLRILRKYRAMGAKTMPMAFAIGLPPAYEIIGNFSGLHMDSWGEMDMAGTLMQQDIEMVPAETIDLQVPAHAEMILEGEISLLESGRTAAVTSPSMYCLPHHEDLPQFRLTGVTMRADRPIYRNHQTCPATDHQVLPRLCHEAVLYNRLQEMGLDARDVSFPAWGGALSCILQFNYTRQGSVNDALMMAMGAPWINTKLVIAVSPDTDIYDAAAVYHALATRVDPARDVLIVGNTRGSLYDPSGAPVESDYPFRTVGKMGIDATIKTRHNPVDFERAWPMNWGKVFLRDYL